MRRLWLASTLATAAFASFAPRAGADSTEVGAFLGPRVFSSDANLGYLPKENFHPHLLSDVGFGLRVARSFGVEWLFPEFEIAMVPAGTNAVGGATAVSVFWMEPRVNLRVDLQQGKRLTPFALLGGGAPIAFSDARKTFNSGVTGEGYLGGGVRFDTERGFMLRFDARASAQPGGSGVLAFEGDFNVSVEYMFGATHKKRNDSGEIVVAAVPKDTDNDGLLDGVDKCPDRAEDKDSFEDEDGCPEIDNDGDRVLDIADKCPTEAESINGYMDDDGCNDQVPPEVAALVGTIEGLLYADGETIVHDSGLRSIQKIAKTLIAQPSVKIILIGHTDDREAKAFITPPPAGKPPAPDQPPPASLDSVSIDLSRARAEAVRQALVDAGVPEGRIVVDGVGADDAVSDNGTAKGRLANRRVELKLFVPK